LPSNNLDDAPVFQATESMDVAPSDRALDSLIPDNANKPYDMRILVEALLDESDFLEVHAIFAPNILVGFGRIEGRSVGIIANQPSQFAGTLDIDASEKAARFVRLCDAFGIPVITLVDVPGFLPGTEQEWDGIIRRGAKLIYAYGEASVPLITVITRKAYGGAYIVMGSKQLGADINLAWPSAQIAVMGAQGAVNVLHRREIAADPSVAAGLIKKYEDELLNPYIAADKGLIDAVIEPHQTRRQITMALRALRNKRVDLPTRKHGNIPL
jgi:propionyl-CoA carboxylase beta chain